jgi:hypothetical protein
VIPSVYYFHLVTDSLFFSILWLKYSVIVCQLALPSSCLLANFSLGFVSVGYTNTLNLAGVVQLNLVFTVSSVFLRCVADFRSLESAM